MKTLVLSILCLFVFLLTGNQVAHVGNNQASTSVSSSVSPPHHLYRTSKPVEFPKVKLANYHSLLCGSQDVFEAESENEDFTFVKKNVTLVSYFIVLAATFFLSNADAYYKSQLPSCSHFSYTSTAKYITQRVLRI